MTHKPTPETRAQVAALKSYGHTLQEIGRFLGICDDTLNFHYSREIATAEINANAEVARSLFRRATKKDDVSAQIFWLKTRARWRTVETENLIDQNESLKKELIEIKAQLDEKHKKDY